MEIVYKNALPDWNQYFNLFESTGWNSESKLTKEELYATLKGSYFSISAYSSKELIGFGRIISDGIFHAMIYEMMVYPKFQGQGVGSYILNKLLKKCIENNIRDIQLFSAKGKRGFYEKFGFTARPDDGPGMEYIREF